MKRGLVLVALLCLAFSGTATSGRAATDGEGGQTARWVFPGEYESHQAMWMLWPTLENKAGFPSTEPAADMIRAMRGHTHVNLGVQDADDERAARAVLAASGVSLEHVHFFHIPHGDLWVRDTGPQFTRNQFGRLRAADWSFSMWGGEEPGSEFSLFEEPVDRTIAEAIGVPVISARPGPATGVRMINEGGGASHNGRGTMIAVESVVMQRNLGPNRFCGGQPPVTDYSQPNTYAPNPDWPACRARVERELHRVLGVEKVIWLPTGVIEDNATFRGPLATHIQIPRLDGVDVPHPGVYTVFTTNGHTDEFVRFVTPTKVLLAKAVLSDAPARTPVARLRQWMEEQNHERLERVYRILSKATTESGERIEVVRIPTPLPFFEVFQPGDGIYDYFAAYDRWEDGSTLPSLMLGVWAAAYLNYVPTNDLVMVSKFWKPGRPLEMKRRDEEARAILQDVFPGREIVQVFTENINRGGGGMNCITQQQPASATFARLCGWAKVRVEVSSTPLYASESGKDVIGRVPRVSGGDDVYLERLHTDGHRVRVRVKGAHRLGGEVGWVDADAIESAGEKCAAVYSRN